VSVNGGSASMSYNYFLFSYVPNTLSMKTGSYTYSIKSWVDELNCLPSLPTYCYVYAPHTSQMDGENGDEINSVNFNQDNGCFIVSTSTGIRVYNTHDF
jgi:hypothetical protein